MIFPIFVTKICSFVVVIGVGVHLGTAAFIKINDTYSRPTNFKSILLTNLVLFPKSTGWVAIIDPSPSYLRHVRLLTGHPDPIRGGTSDFFFH